MNRKTRLTRFIHISLGTVRKGNSVEGRMDGFVNPV